jgi:hypothetical protein
MRFTVGFGMLVALLPTSSRATVLYTSFETTYYGSYSTSATFEGTPFTPTASGILGTVMVQGVFAKPGPAGLWPMGLYTDASGEPGTLLESWNVAVPDISSPDAIIAISSVLQPYLSAGTPYWFVIEDTTGATNMTWGSYYGTTGGAWVGSSINTLEQVFANDPIDAIELDSSAAPEPSSGVLTGAGGGTLLLWLRSKKGGRGARGPSILFVSVR